VTLPSLNGVVYTGSANTGTDEMWLRAYNGAWSNSSQANITDSTTATVISPVTVNAGATAEINSPYEGTVTFAADTGTLKLDNSPSFAGIVAGMSGQDRIDFTDINFATVQKPTYAGNSSGGTLVVTDGTHTANITLVGNYLTSTFVPSNDGHGGTPVVDPPAVLLNQDPASSLHQGSDPTDAELTQLVQAMAVYSAQNPGFNSASTSPAPSDPTLHNAMAAAWHS